MGVLGLSGAPGAIVGGNSNNGLHVGASAVNLNNLVSNANWNIGAASFLSIWNINQTRHFPTPQDVEIHLSVEIIPIKAGPSKREPKGPEVIRKKKPENEEL